MFRAGLFAVLSAQAIYSQQPQFEAASIKPGGDIFSTKPQRSPGRLAWTTQLAYLIGYAYGLDHSRVSGQELGGVVYTINTVFAPKVTDAELRLMLQSLLADRFNMRFHQEVKEVDGYVVSLAKGGMKMKESPAEDQPGPIDPSYVAATGPVPGVLEIRGHRASLLQLIDTLGRNLGMPLWDRTGLKGKYDFEFRYAEDLSAESEAAAPQLATALRESLGLVIKKQRGPLETLVIDHIEQPSGN
jgi:uncharacterized protein (TIGR03435 family)